MSWNAKSFGIKSANIVVLDLEGFKLKSIEFIIKELSLCCSYYDTIFFKAPVSFGKLPTHDKQTVIWLTHNLQGLDWDDGDTPYSDLKTICLSFNFRFTRKFFFAKGTEKCEVLSKLLQKKVYNLKDLNCLRISEILPEETVASCSLHFNIFRADCQVFNHCSERKAKIFSQWTQSDAQRRDSNFNNLSVKQFEDIHLLDSS